MERRIVLIPAHVPEWLDTVRTLFREYSAHIQADLCFQGFERELAELPGSYAPPCGRLLLATCDDKLAGCVAMRPLLKPCPSAASQPPVGPAGACAAGRGADVGEPAADTVCEMKRLYVRPAFRGAGVGRRLATAVVDAARAAGYERMVLDTLAPMTVAIALYHSLGFVETTAYYRNPLGDVTYMELDLRTAPPV